MRLLHPSLHVYDTKWLILFLSYRSQFGNCPAISAVE
jgi:hypothetical protein